MGSTSDEAYPNFDCGPAGGHETEITLSGLLPTVVPPKFGVRGKDPV